MSYASGTEVSVDRSKGELKRVIYKNDGANFQYGETDARILIQFQKENRLLRFVIEFPPPDDDRFVHTPTGRSRTQAAAWKEYEAEQRRRWRALILCIKAKFEIVESGIAEFEEEFMPYIVLPNGQTTAEMVRPMIAEAYETGKMPKARMLIEG